MSRKIIQISAISPPINDGDGFFTLAYAVSDDGAAYRLVEHDDGYDWWELPLLPEGERTGIWDDAPEPC